MRFANKSLKKSQKKAIGETVVRQWIRNKKQVESLNLVHAPWSYEYFEDILFGQTVENIYGYIEFSKGQCKDIWKFANHYYIYYVEGE